MTAFLAALVFFIPLTVGIAMILAERRDRLFLIYGVLLAWAVLFPLTVLVHQWMPFAGGGDDSDYYSIITMATQPGTDWLDLSRFADILEQPGYAVVLLLVSMIFGVDLLTIKLVNLTFFVAVALTWYRIAVLIESATFGRAVFVAVLAVMPLWNYFFFVFKDMTIVLLQSLFVLGLTRQWRYNSLSSWLFIALVTIALLPFRTFLVVQNILVLMGAIGLKQFSSEGGGRALPLIVACIVTLMVLAIASNSELMSLFGVFSEHRIIGSAEMRESVVTLQQLSTVNNALFPLIYLFSETAGFRPDIWEAFDADWLRGVLALPWIFLGVPFFVLGVTWTLKASSGAPIAGSLVGKLSSSRAVTTQWGGVLVFVLSMFIISWIVGDTTRWRISDMPAMATIAMAGWTFGVRRIREQILLLWIAGGGTLFLLYYLFRGV